jgi:thymidylate synthase (FAD)
MFPIVWEAFEDYRLGGMFLSRLDRGVIARLTKMAGETGKSLPVSHEDFLTVQDETWCDLKRCRERDECRQKLESLGLLSPTSGEREA